MLSKNLLDEIREKKENRDALLEALHNALNNGDDMSLDANAAARRLAIDILSGEVTITL